MSNIAGKAYAMNLVTPLTECVTLGNKVIFLALGTSLFSGKLKGLLTLSMIHYARWVIVRPSELPHLSAEQPREHTRYNYQLFFSNFNGSWAQYVDSFSAAIPAGLNSLWRKNIGWPKAVPETPFHRYVGDNQMWTNHYYSAYPMATSNDIKAAKQVKDELRQFVTQTKGKSPAEFVESYNRLLKSLQNALGQMAETPIVSLATQAVEERRRADAQTEVESRR